MDFKQFEDLFEFSEKNGFSEEEIAKNEKRLGIKLPPVLRQLFLSYGKDNLLNSYHYFIPPNNWHISSDWLTFYISHQAVCGWAINIQEFERATCKVYCFHDELHYEEDSSIAHFLIKLGVYYWDMLFPFRIETKEITTEDEATLIKKFDDPKSKITYPNLYSTQYFWKDSSQIAVLTTFRENQHFFFVTKEATKLTQFRELFAQKTWKTLPNKTHERKYRKKLIRFDADIAELEEEKKESKAQVNTDDLPF